MLTCKSPRKVMRAAYHLARQSLPDYSSKFSRKDYTLPQLFACLAAKEVLRRSYRGAEALLRDCDNWLRDVGLSRAPDHNTLCRAAKFLLKACRVNRLLDQVARWAAVARLLGLSKKPLAIDSTCFESRHASRHYERRRRAPEGGGRRRRPARGRGSGEKARRRGIRRAGRRVPKLAVASTGHGHLVLALWTGTGNGADHGHFEPVLFHAWRRVPNRRFDVAADAGYDSEANHRLARHDMGLRALVPALIGRRGAGGKPPSGRWRRHMARLLKTKASRRRCGYTQRWQVETVNSMIKRNLGSSLRGASAWSRRRDMMLKVLVHDLMVL
jgi:hypothetical protein